MTLTKRPHIRELRKQFPTMPDNCLKCYLFNQCQTYKFHIVEPIPSYLANNIALFIVLDNPSKDDDTFNTTGLEDYTDKLNDYLSIFKEIDIYSSFAVKCYVKGKIYKHYIKQCSQFLKEDIDFLKNSYNKVYIIAFGEAANLGLEEVKNTYNDNEQLVWYSTKPENITAQQVFDRVESEIIDNLLHPEFLYIDTYPTALTGTGKRIAIDFEWHPDTKIPHAVGIAFKDTAYGIPLTKEVRQLLRRIFENKEATVINFNLPADINIALDLGFKPKCSFLDARILANELLDVLPYNGLTDYAYWILQTPMYKKGFTIDSYKEVTNELLTATAYDAYSALKLYEYLEEEFSEEYGAMRFSREIDMSLILPLAIAARKGIKVNLNNLAKVKKELGNTCSKLEKKIEKKYGLKKIKKNYSPNDIIKTFKKLYKIKLKTTKKEILASYAETNQLAADILAWREASTLLTNYLQNLPTYMDDNCIVHPDCEVSKAVTGRSSYSRPPMQNFKGSIRRIFETPWEEQGEIWSLDASQSEYKIIAYLAGVEELMVYFMLSNSDIHQKTYEDVANAFSSPPKKWSRRGAKTINFASLYGASEHKLIETFVSGQDCGLTKKQAEIAAKVVMKRVEQFEPYFTHLEQVSTKQGYVESPYGRRNYRLNYGQIRNTPTQSFSADLNKERFAWLSRKFMAKNLISYPFLEYHDGVEICVFKKEAKQVEEIINNKQWFIPDVLARNINIPLPCVLKKHGRFWE